MSSIESISLIKESHSTPMIMEPSFRVSVLTPLYNERRTLEVSLQRVLSLCDPLINSLELIVVDDGSSDGSTEILKHLVMNDSRIKLIRHRRNQGKGAALRSALAVATGDICVVHDADLEYDPRDIPALLAPFAHVGVEAVYGSRFLPNGQRRLHAYQYRIINKGLTTLGNWLTNLCLTDIETGYKAVKTTLLKSIPLRMNDFRFEIEITFRLSQRGTHVIEVPIRYHPRTRKQGKKIDIWDGVLAAQAMIWCLITSSRCISRD